jgi:hypothetical protein
MDMAGMGRRLAPVLLATAGRVDIASKRKPGQR